MSIKISIHKAKRSRLHEEDFDKIVFGKNPTDHIFLAEYESGIWKNFRIQPFSDLSISPIALGLHYGQTVFEGMKAYRLENQKINLFRPIKHLERFNKSLERMSMPVVPKDLFLTALETLLECEKEWIPNSHDSSLYIRPFMIATEPRLGVNISEEYLFAIVCMPMSKYYMKNLKVKVETKFTRAASGGTGYAKCGGNYGGAFLPTLLAKKEGFDQVIWTDANAHQFIEESGTMNIMFVIDNVIVTPPISDSILDGITRDSVLAIARDLNIQVQERPIRYSELEQALQRGAKVEAFGVGTAAVISPIETIAIGEKQYKINSFSDSLALTIRAELENMRLGKTPDRHFWNYIVE